MDHTKTWETHHQAPAQRTVIDTWPAIAVRAAGLPEQLFIGSDDALLELKARVRRIPGVTIRVTTVNVIR
jgi:hypothetical protein